MAANSTITYKRDELRDSFLKRGLVVVAGTGVSRQTAGFPEQPGSQVAGWQGLLESGVDYCERYQLVTPKNADIARIEIRKPDSTDDLIDVAGKIVSWLDDRRNGRIQWIKETIGQLRVHDSALIKAIEGLGGLITTLNYDDLLHTVTSRECVHWKELQKINGNIINYPQDYILHIHGHWSSLDSIILDRQSYNALLKDDKIQHLIKGFALYNTMLFIGCGETFQDPNFQMLIKWCDSALEGNSVQ